MEMREYLDTVSGQIRNKKAKQAVEEEMRRHIEDQAQALAQSGMEPEEALSEAVRQMGNPVEVGIEMDRIHRPRNNWKLLGGVAVLSLLGLLVQYHCIYRFGPRELAFVRMGEEAFARQCVFTLMGLAVMTFLYLCDYTIFSRYGKLIGFVFLGAVALACGLDLIPVLNGGHSYIKTIMYLFIPIYGGILYSYRARAYRGIVCAVLWLAAAAYVAFYLIGGGIGITVNVIAVCSLMLAMALFKNWYKVRHRFAPVLVIGGLWLVTCILTVMGMQEYQLMRLKVMLKPAYGQAKGFQSAVTREILGRLNLVGGMQTGAPGLEGTPMRLLPGAQYDYVILQAASTWGALAAVLIALLLALLLLYLFFMVKGQNNQLGQMIGYGSVLVLALETAGNLLYNMGFVLLSTAGLPFFSYGRCHTLAVYGLLGILLSIYRYRNLIWEKAENREDRDGGVLASLGRYRIRIERTDG
ncbi:MAG: permease prefix domain 1-containing protein [Clostridium sp.]|nr:permease prefix domain 1-containing protein [Clostridium sp.]